MSQVAVILIMHFLDRCGMCDEVFEIETEFTEHCFCHFKNDPRKDTFLEVFEMRLLSYFIP